MAMAVGSNGNRKGSATPSINVTPLVDIVLVVLIIFMLVTPMMTKTFWLNLPPKSEAKQDNTPTPPVETKPVVMTVDKSGAVRVNNVPLQKSDIRERLPRVMAGAHQRVLYFDAADDAPYSVAVEAMDLSRASGVKQIAILTEKVAK
jgi:biopolymer transport protein ExbD/biopolymer transport protein TolR